MWHPAHSAAQGDELTVTAVVPAALGCSADGAHVKTVLV